MDEGCFLFFWLSESPISLIFTDASAALAVLHGLISVDFEMVRLGNGMSHFQRLLFFFTYPGLQPGLLYIALSGLLGAAGATPFPGTFRRNGIVAGDPASERGMTFVFLFLRGLE